MINKYIYIYIYIYIYYPKQKQSLSRMRVFLDVSFIGADGFQKGCIFLSGNYDCRLVKKVIKPA